MAYSQPPHTSEIVEILDLPKKLIKKRSPVAAYRWAQRRCRERVNDYVGVRPEHAALGRSYVAGYELAKWRVLAFGPDRKPWRQGWRTANCGTSTPAA